MHLYDIPGLQSPVVRLGRDMLRLKLRRVSAALGLEFAPICTGSPDPGLVSLGRPCSRST